MISGIAIIFGLIVLCLTVYLLIKQYEVRTVLLGAGFIMAFTALLLGFVDNQAGMGSLMDAFRAFTTNMVAAGLIQNICATLGFAAILTLTGCDKHLIHALAKGLSKIRPVMIPGVAIATFCINIALPSAAGCAAAVGVVMIPLLISQGINPAIAASAVMLGTFGSMLSPGLMHNPMIAELAGMDAMGVIKGHAPAVIASILIGAAWLTFWAKFRGEDRGFQSSDLENVDHNFKVNPFLAILPLVPVLILLTFSSSTVRANISWAASFTVPMAMLFGAFLCMLFTRTNPQEVTKKFFDGMGRGYGDVLGIIIAAGVFVAGMQSLGMVNAFIEAMKNTESIVKIAGTYGPFLLGVVSGSGDAAALAFNGAVTPHAESFGIAINKMGSMAALAGALGRTMSPLAGAAIICAGLARVNPFEMSKRLAPGMIIASIVSMIIMFYL
jgi:DcuC family C4-dicarboxylate transporter